MLLFRWFNGDKGFTFYVVSTKAPKVYTSFHDSPWYECGLEFRDATLQVFEEVQKLQKYRLLIVPENFVFW